MAARRSWSPPSQLAVYWTKKLDGDADAAGAGAGAAAGALALASLDMAALVELEFPVVEWSGRRSGLKFRERERKSGK